MTDDRVPIVAEVFRLFFGSRKKAAPCALDLRGFRMTRREAAGWIYAATIAVDTAPETGPSLADNVEQASRADLFHWSRRWRGPEPYQRLVSALMLAAWRGPDFWRPKLCVMRCGRPALRAPEWEPDAGAVYCDDCGREEDPEIPEAERLRVLWRMVNLGDNERS